MTDIAHKCTSTHGRSLYCVAGPPRCEEMLSRLQPVRTNCCWASSHARELALRTGTEHAEAEGKFGDGLLCELATTRMASRTGARRYWVEQQVAFEGVTAAWDTPYMVKGEDFMRCVDPDDFACRESAIVRDLFLSGWFYEADGARYFNLPAFYLRKGRAYFINGRHRTVLLSRHLALLPMALTQLDTESHGTLERLVDRKLELGESIFLPDLPIVETILR